MKNLIILDTGPLVAYLSNGDKYHGWAKKRFQEIVSPVITCQAVISEACFLVRNIHQGRETILEMIERNLIQTEFNLNVEAKALKQFIHKYQSVPMSLADAGLVRMSEIYEDAKILTLDRDFIVYRKNKHIPITCITPFDS
jgi:Predicted nucleic acid-binding protein, contains PIN domain